MRPWQILLLLGVTSITAYGGDANALQISAQPFEPRAYQFFKRDDKFAHPVEIVPARLLWPFEYRRGESSKVGDVVVLVQIDDRGSAKRLLVLSSDDELFTRETVNALKRARWEAGHGDVWFYFLAHFDLESPEFMKQNHATEPSPTSGTSAAEHPPRQP